MSGWIMWFIVAGILVIMEIFTGTFYLLMISFGLAAGGVAGLIGGDTSLQLIVAAVVGAISTYALRRSHIGSPQKVEVARDPNAHLDIGKAVKVNDWLIDGSGKSTARVMYRGAMWDVELEPHAVSKPGTFMIKELRGSCLIVTNTNE